MAKNAKSNSSSNAVSIATLKTQAKHLQRVLKKTLSQDVTTAQSLELIAGQYGYDNWDTLAGVLKKPVPSVATPTLASLPFMPHEMEVEQGPRSVRYDVSDYDAEAMNLVHDEKALKDYLAEHKDWYSDGLDSVVLQGSGDGEDVSFTIRQLMGLKYHELGGCGNWELPDGDTWLRFICGSAELFWTHKPKVTTPVVGIPPLLKADQGSDFLVVASNDGYEYDIHVIVPSTVGLAKAKALIDEEIARLKAVDAAHGDDDQYEEYTETDIKAFITSIGCKVVATRHNCDDTWD